MTDAANREPSDVNGSRVTSDVDGSRTTSYVDVDVIVLALPNRAAELARPPTIVVKNLHGVLHNLSGNPTTPGRR